MTDAAKVAQAYLQTWNEAGDGPAAPWRIRHVVGFIDRAGHRVTTKKTDARPTGPERIGGGRAASAAPLPDAGGYIVR
jgi:hypothetical protein